MKDKPNVKRQNSKSLHSNSIITSDDIYFLKKILQSKKYFENENKRRFLIQVYQKKQDFISDVADFVNFVISRMEFLYFFTHLL